MKHTSVIIVIALTLTGTLTRFHGQDKKEEKQNILQFFEIVKMLETSADKFDGESSSFSADSGGIGDAYGVSGWVRKNGQIFFKIYDDYLVQWNQEKKNNSSLVLWVAELDFEKAFAANLGGEAEVNKWLKELSGIPEPVTGLMTSSGNVVTLLVFSKGRIEVAKRNLNIPELKGHHHD